VEGKLLIAPCQSEEIKTKFVNFEGGIINKFEIEILNAELEILAHKQETINSINHQQGSDTLWEQTGQQGKELAEQLEHEVDEKRHCKNHQTLEIDHPRLKSPANNINSFPNGLIFPC
ncbi:unnamed protein product, partial [Onchocerca ochengi]